MIGGAIKGELLMGDHAQGEYPQEHAAGSRAYLHFADAIALAIARVIIDEALVLNGSPEIGFGHKGMRMLIERDAFGDDGGIVAARKAEQGDEGDGVFHDGFDLYDLFGRFNDWYLYRC